MIDTAVVGQPAFILRHQPYRESSLILRLFTPDYGIIAALAKGVRKPKSKTAGMLLPFKALRVSLRGKTALKTLTAVEVQPDVGDLTGLAVYCGFYLNELIASFCHEYDPHPEVYHDYVGCLQRMSVITTLADATGALSPPLQLEAALRVFELGLLRHVGLAPPLGCDADTGRPIKPDADYRVYADRGPVEHRYGPVSGKTLQAMHKTTFNDASTLREVKNIMRNIINFHLHGRPLKSRAVLAKVYPQLAPCTAVASAC